MKIFPIDYIFEYYTLLYTPNCLKSHKKTVLHQSRLQASKLFVLNDQRALVVVCEAGGVTSLLYPGLFGVIFILSRPISGGGRGGTGRVLLLQGSFRLQPESSLQTEFL